MVKENTYKQTTMFLCCELLGEDQNYQLSYSAYPYNWLMLMIFLCSSQ